MKLAMTTELLGKKVLITGAARGIGRATALRLAKAGADIAINFVTSESAAIQVAKEVQELGREVLVIKADVSEEDDVRQMLQQVADRWGKFDILVSNAASGGFRSLRSATGRNFDAAMHTNVRALMYLVQASLPLFRTEKANAKVIALSSHGSLRALPDYGLIGTSKAALESLLRQMAFEFGGEGINFNCVLAGMVATDSTQGFPGAAEAHAYANSRMMLQKDKVLTAEAVADAIHFLASPASDFVQGHTLIVDGGACLRI